MDVISLAEICTLDDCEGRSIRPPFSPARLIKLVAVSDSAERRDEAVAPAEHDGHWATIPLEADSIMLSLTVFSETADTESIAISEKELSVPDDAVLIFRFLTSTLDRLNGDDAAANLLNLKIESMRAVTEAVALPYISVTLAL